MVSLCLNRTLVKSDGSGFFVCINKVRSKNSFRCFKSIIKKYNGGEAIVNMMKIKVKKIASTIYRSHRIIFIKWRKSI
jgi:hypothetical protein